MMDGEQRLVIKMPFSKYDINNISSELRKIIYNKDKIWTATYGMVAGTLQNKMMVGYGIYVIKNNNYYYDALLNPVTSDDLSSDYNHIRAVVNLKVDVKIEDTKTINNSHKVFKILN